MRSARILRRLCALGACASAVVVSAAAAGPAVPGLPRGDARLDDRHRLLGFDSPYRLLDMSADGARLAFAWSTRARTWLGVIDPGDRSLRLLAPMDAGDAAAFAPDGARIAYLHDEHVRVVDASTSETAVVAPAHPRSHVWWVDTRIAYVDPDRRLVLHDPSGAAVSTPLTVPDPPRRDTLVGNVSVSPDGSRALYARDCRPWLMDLATGDERALAPAPHGAYRHWGYKVPPVAWPPDAQHLVVQKVIDDRCKSPGGPGWQDILFTGDGERIGHVLGDDGGLSHWHDLAWSTDSRWLTVTMQPTGTQVGGIQQLWAVDLAHRTRSLLLRYRVASRAFVNGDGTLFVARYDDRSGLDSHGAVLSAILQP